MSGRILTDDDVTEKVVGAFTFLYAHREVTPTGIGSIAATTVPEVLRFTEDNGIELASPCQFHYRHDTDRALVVVHMGFAVKQTPKASGPFQIAHLEPWSCIATVHHGSMRGIDEAWSALEIYARRRNMRRRLTREVFAQWIDFDSAENVTELQFGL